MAANVNLNLTGLSLAINVIEITGLIVGFICFAISAWRNTSTTAGKDKLSLYGAVAIVAGLAPAIVINYLCAY
jgi:hypothetical protein